MDKEDPYRAADAKSTVIAPVKIGRYLIGKTLGHGSFGKVKQAQHAFTQTQVAIKIIPRKRISTVEMIEKVKREVQILKMLRHPHVVHLHEVIEAPSEIFLVMEVVMGQELFDFLVSRGRLHEEEARRLFQQLASALAHCHVNGIVHRDLKPENILITPDLSIKVADFGLANVMIDGEFLRTSCGSPNYASPEVIEGLLYAGPEVDVWSSGVILYAMLVGSLPFDDEVISRLFKRIISGSYPMPSYLSEDSRQLLSRMLCVDCLKRITFAEVRKSAWFKYRLTPYLGVTPTRKERRQEEEPLDEQVLVDLLKLEAFRPLQPYPKLVREWLNKGLLWKIQGPPKNASGEDLKHWKHCGSFRVCYELLLEEKINRMNHLQQQRGVADLAQQQQLHQQQRPHRTLAFSPGGQSVRVPSEFDLARHNEDAGEAVAGRSWYLGIQSKKETTLVMAEVFRALRNLKCQWCVFSPFRIFCRWRPLCSGLDTHLKADVWIYASLQVYKIQSKVYLLDFQRLGSHSNSLAWLNFSTLIINALKPPSRSGNS